MSGHQYTAYMVNDELNQFQEMQGGGNPDAIISLGVNVLKMDPKNGNHLSAIAH